MKRFFAVVCAMIFCFSFVSCRSEEEGSIFQYDIEHEPINLDPQSAEDYESLLVIQNIFEGLLTVNESGQLTEGVAKNWTASDDGKRYTFFLRENAAWSDETPVTADDFVFAFQRLFTATTNAPKASEFFCIKNSRAALEGKKPVDQIGVKAVGQHQLEFELETANAMFLQLLTTAPAMPCNKAFFYHTKGKYGLEASVKIEKETVWLTLCNGPFYLSRWSHGGSLRLRRNEYYQGRQAVSAGGVNFIIFQEPEEEEEPVSFAEYSLQRFLDGTTDALIVDGAAYHERSWTDYSGASYENTTVGLLFQQTDPMLKNKNIRKALFLLTVPEAFADYLPEDCAVARAVIPPGITMLDKHFRDYAGFSIMPEYQPALAKQYYLKGIEELGKGQTEEVTVLVSDPEQERLFGYLSQIWQRELSFYVRVEVVSPVELIKRVQKKSFSMALYPLSGSFNGPDSILSQFITGRGNNYAGYSNRNYDAYMSNGLKNFDMVKTAENYKKAEQLLIEDGVFLPLYYQKEYFVALKDTTGILYDPQSRLISFAYALKKD